MVDVSKQDFICDEIKELKKPDLTLETVCFNLLDTIECGQCFRWIRLDNSEDRNKSEFIGIICDRVLRVKQVNNYLFVYSNNTKNLKSVIEYYFDLYNNYEMIEKEISLIDDNIKKAVEKTSGIHILNQANIETLISFIISSNNNIPRIKKSIENICKKYGTSTQFEGETYYLFPTLEQLKDVTVSEFRECGVGFRDKYIVKTVADLLENNIYSSCTSKLTNSQLKKVLMSFVGVGPKVADCVMLFSFGRQDVFPIDVWVKRVMEKLYFDESVSKEEILSYAEITFNKYQGIVQQHLFHNIRNDAI